MLAGFRITAALGRSFELHYACRTRAEMAFREVLATRSNVHLHVDADAGGVLNVPELCRGAPPAAHLYCCGPAPMLAAFEAATSGRARDHVHLESFAARLEGATEGGFELELRRSGLVRTVRPGQRILDVLREAGVEVLTSCEEGVCGSCETGVLEGVPDHRCEVLSERERREGRTMMVCCGGARSARLALDL